MGKEQKYYNFNSTMLDPVCVRDYVSPDGMWAVVPCIGEKEWVIIHNGSVLSDVSRTFQSAMNKVEKYKKRKSPKKATSTPSTASKTKKKTKSSGQSNKVAQSTGNPLLDALQ